MQLIDQWERILAELGDEVAVVEAPTGRSWRFAQLAEAADARPDGGEPWVIARGGGVGFLAATLQAWRSGRPLVPVDSDEPDPALLAGLPGWTAHVKQTSGSTGRPRLVLFRAEQIAADAAAIVSTMGLRRDLPNVAVISMGHSYGFSNLVTPLLLHGIPMILADSALPAAVEAALAVAEEAGGRCVLPAVPAMWRAWAAAGLVRRPIDVAISAGAPLPLDLEQAVLSESGIKIHNFYGSSECGGIAFDRRSDARSSASEVGTPLQGVAVSRLVDGRLVVCSTAVGERYWPDEDADLAGGLFRTADLGRLEDGDRIVLEGRLADVINVAGRKVSPERIEAVLRGEPGIRDCLVFGIPSRDEARVDEVVACLAVDGGDPASAVLARVRRRAGRDLASWEVPRHWHLEPALAPDARGKLSRAAWRSRYLEALGNGGGA